MMSIFKKILKFLPNRKNIGSAGPNSKIEFPVYVAAPEALQMEENSLIRQGTKIINAPYEKVLIRKYTVVGVNCTIVTNGHRSTVGVPHILLGASHINDKSCSIEIGEDVWIGVNVTILAGANLGRGCIVGAASTVTKPVPPYALVVGSPAKIVGVKFSIDQIIKHEKCLYPKGERLSKEYLVKLFEDYYEGKKVFGVETELGHVEQDKLREAMRARNFISNSFVENMYGW